MDDIPRHIAMADRLGRQADRDLEAARQMLQPRFSYLAANLAHQAVEKALKAACWRVSGKEPPWGHGLGALLAVLGLEPRDIPDSVYAAIAILEPLFGRTRYPSGRLDEPIPADLIDEKAARLAIDSADEVITWLGTLPGAG